MIKFAEIINQPCSGEFEERVYDNDSSWNSQDWTWVKFTKSDLTEWIGEFRGSARQIAISYKTNETIILTSDYVFLLDNATGNVKELENQPQYHNLTTSPNGTFIFADYYQIERMITSLKDMEIIQSPIEMDMIEFQGWNKDILEFTCNEFTNWDRHLVMELDINDWKIKIKNTIHKYK